MPRIALSLENSFLNSIAAGEQINMAYGIPAFNGYTIKLEQSFKLSYGVVSQQNNPR